MKSRNQVLKKLFLSTLYLSAFTFGGGYVIVTQHSWLSPRKWPPARLRSTRPRLSGQGLRAYPVR